MQSLGPADERLHSQAKMAAPCQAAYADHQLDCDNCQYLYEAPLQAQYQHFSDHHHQHNHHHNHSTATISSQPQQVQSGQEALVRLEQHQPALQDSGQQQYVYVQWAPQEQQLHESPQVSNYEPEQIYPFDCNNNAFHTSQYQLGEAPVTNSADHSQPYEQATLAYNGHKNQLRPQEQPKFEQQSDMLLDTSQPNAHIHDGQHLAFTPNTGAGQLDGASPAKLPADKRRRRPPRNKSVSAQARTGGKLWEFIRDLLLNDSTNPSFIRWERREDGVFKFVQSDKVAKMWGERKQNPKMTYEKLSRAMRYYYKSKVLLPVLGRRLVYKFGPNATGWLHSGALVSPIIGPSSQ